ncbi:MAG: O-antigen ligase family protein, partial [Phycisphaerales bacterium]|nr:O-antigen ligase family protein [Phycisphaerales bacterium]
LVTRMSEGTRLRQVAFLALGAAGVAGILLPSRRQLRIDLLLSYPLVLLVSWCFLSILWSHAPALTAKRFIVLLAMIAAVVALVRRHTLVILPTIGLAYGATCLIVGVVAEAVFGGSPMQAGYRFAGTMHPNHTGICMVLLVLGALALADWRTPSRRWFFALATAGGIGLLMTQSRTALFAGVFGALVMTIVRWPLRRLILVGLPVLWSAAVLGTLYTLDLVPPIWQKALLARQDSDVTTLTGRTDIWRFALRHLTRDEARLMIGFGFDSFWTPEMARDVSRFVQFKISEGHSAYIDTTLELGLIGAALYSFCLLTAFGRWCWYARRTRAATAAFAAGLTGFAIIHGLTESATVDAHLWTLLLWSAMAFAALARPRVEGGIVK